MFIFKPMKSEASKLRNCEMKMHFCPLVSFLSLRMATALSFGTLGCTPHRSAPLIIRIPGLPFRKTLRKLSFGFIMGSCIHLFASWAACLRSLAFRFPPLIFLWNIHTVKVKKSCFCPFLSIAFSTFPINQDGGRVEDY